MNKIIFGVICMLATLTCNAQSTKEHVIERGETIETIADKYGVTIDDITNANPEIKDMFFAGMVIRIPESTSDTSSDNDDPYIRILRQSDNGDNDYVADSTTSDEDNNSDYTAQDGLNDMRLKGNNGLRFKIGYNINSIYSSKGKDNLSANYSSGASIGFNILFRHYFLDGLYGEAGTGLNWSSTNTTTYVFETEFMDRTKIKSEYQTFAIPIDLFVGYTFGFSSKVGLDLYTGPMVNIGVYNSRKTNGKNFTSKTSTGFGWSAGASVHLADFDLGACYTFPLTDNLKLKNIGDVKQNSLEIYIGWTLKL